MQWRRLGLGVGLYLNNIIKIISDTPPVLWLVILSLLIAAAIGSVLGDWAWEVVERWKGRK